MNSFNKSYYSTNSEKVIPWVIWSSKEIAAAGMFPQYVFTGVFINNIFCKANTIPTKIPASSAPLTSSPENSTPSSNSWFSTLHSCGPPSVFHGSSWGECVPKTLSVDLGGHNYSHNSAKTYLPFSLLLASLHWSQKQWWVKLLTPCHESNLLYYLLIIIFFTAL